MNGGGISCALLLEDDKHMYIYNLGRSQKEPSSVTMMTVKNAKRADIGR